MPLFIADGEGKNAFKKIHGHGHLRTVDAQNRKSTRNHMAAGAAFLDKACRDMTGMKPRESHAFRGWVLSGGLCEIISDFQLFTKVP